jgi:hypothetical protein
MVPGYCLAMGKLVGGQAVIYPNVSGGSPRSFCVTDQFDDGTFLYFQTDIIASRP